MIQKTLLGALKQLWSQSTWTEEQSYACQSFRFPLTNALLPRVI
jgi:hypothetical protein